MEPAYHNGQIVIIDKCHRDYHKGDVIAFQCDGLSAVLVKRIAAEPGDRVEIRDGKLLVNGKASQIFDEEFIFEFSGLLEEELRMEEGQYCVIGDNVPESRDSRYEEVGIVEEKGIIGKVI